MLRTSRYLANVMAFGAVVVSHYLVVGQLTPIRHSMVNESPDGLVCDFYNAAIFPRSPHPVAWACSGGDVFSEPLPTIAAILAVCAALFVLRFTVQGLSTNYFPGFFALFLCIASGVAVAVRSMFLIQGTANIVYGLWTIPLVAVFLLSKFYLDHRPRYMPPVSEAEKSRRHKVELSADVEIAERLREREKNGRA
jgi:hypothetical protein